MTKQRYQHSEKPRPLIAVVTETFTPEVNGVAQTLHQISQKLAQKCRIQIIRPRQAADVNNPQVSSLDTGYQIEDQPSRPVTNGSKQTISELTIRGLPIPGYSELRFGLPCKSKLVRLWSAARPLAIYVATQGPLGWSALAAAKHLSLPVVSGFHTNFHRYSHYYGLSWLYHFIRNYLVHFHQRTAFTLVPTEQMANELTNIGITNAQVCSRGIDQHVFNPGRRSNSLRLQWGADRHSPVFIYVGRLAREKNVLLSLAAFDRVRRQTPNARIVLVGGGPQQAMIKNKYPHVILAGVKKGDDLATYYASADIFLFPSLTETFGNVVLEAIASGLAIVSYDTAAAKDLLVHNESALLATPGDEHQFCQFALDMATRPAELTRIRSNTRRICRSQQWQTIADHFLNLLLSANHQGDPYEIQYDVRSVQTRR